MIAPGPFKGESRSVYLQVPDDVQGISTPMLFICAENDAQFPEKNRTAVQQALEDKSPGVTGQDRQVHPQAF